MKSAKSNSAKIKHDQVQEKAKSQRVYKKEDRNPLQIDAHYREHIGRLISKRNLPNVVY